MALISCPECSRDISASAASCPQCGHPIDNDRSAIVNTELQCPVCGREDQVQFVQAIVESGTTNTVGGALTAPVFHPGGLSSTIFASQSQSLLSRRLSGWPTPPWHFNASPGFTTFAISIGLAYLYLENLGGDWAHAVTKVFVIPFLMIPIWLTLYVAIRVILQNANKPRVLKWQEATASIYKSKFCHRDSIMFNSSSYGSPEDFIAAIYKRHGVQPPK